MSNVRLENIKKIYPLSEKRKEDRDEPEDNGLQITAEGVIAVQSFSLDIQDGEFIVFVGPSGCGKTTTLRMIAGLETITDGDLYIDDVRVNEVPPKDRDVAMVFQSYALYPHMTVYDNLAFSLKMAKVSKSVITQKVKDVAKMLDIESFLKRKPRELSGGQKQRVAIGRALVREPKVLLMDEPLSNLDAKLRSQTRAELINLHNRIGTTIIYVTHDQVEAMTLADRIVVMKDGFIQQIGTPHEIYANPKNLFVAGFMGSPQMNFVDDCELITQNGKKQVRIFDVLLDLTEQQTAKLNDNNIPDGSYTFGIRPADIDLEKNTFTGKIDIVELLGSEEQIHISTGEASLICSVRINSSESGKRANGGSISFGFDINCIKLFDANKEAVL